jgi:hypothetical protein
VVSEIYFTAILYGCFILLSCRRPLRAVQDSGEILVVGIMNFCCQDYWPRGLFLCGPHPSFSLSIHFLLVFVRIFTHLFEP